jgi:AraC-like DNA-binding protein
MTSDNLPKVYLYRRIVQAKLYIDTDYADINLDDIAGEAYFSKFHFLRLFKTAYGKTPHQYLTYVRIEKAKELLLTDMPVIDVCFTVGFSSVSSFTGLFKRITKLTPSLYQQLQKERKTEINSMPLKFIPNCFAEQKGWTKKSNF